MPEVVLLTYTLNKQLWQQFAEAHLSLERSLKVGYVLGSVCFITSAAGFSGAYPSRTLALLLLLSGFIGVLLKPIGVALAVHRARHHPFFDQEVTVSVSPQEVSMRRETAGFCQPWDNFIGYRRLEVGFLLYYDRTSYFFLPAQFMTAGQANRVEEMLHTAKLVKL